MDATFGDDFSVVNLPANLLFKQIELYVGNTNVWYLTFCKPKITVVGSKVSGYR